MTTIGIATIPSRIDSLKKTVGSLHFQCDKMYIGLNGDFSGLGIVDWLSQFKNVVPFQTDNSKGDAEKFRYADSVQGYYLGCDDDLVYPGSYVTKLIAGVNLYNGLVSLHGRTYPIPAKGFKQWIGNYRCLNTVSEDVKVNLVGSGCCAFHTDRLKISINDFIMPNMADCYLSRQAYLKGVPMVVLAHKIGYLTYCPPKDNKTIWNTTKNYSEHTKVLQSYLE